MLYKQIFNHKSMDYEVTYCNLTISVVFVVFTNSLVALSRNGIISATTSHHTTRYITGVFQHRRTQY